jgi:hypothetical protein
MPDELVEKASVDLSEMGRTGLQYSGGIVTEEFLPNLTGIAGIKIYKEMRDNDPIIGAVMMAIENLVKQADWDLIPASDSPEDVSNADFVDSCFNDMNMPWKTVVSEIMSMVVFGWSYFEVVYKLRNGAPLRAKGSKFTDSRIGWEKFAPRSQDSLDSWVFKDNGDVIAMIQSPPPDYTRRTIPISKALHFRTNSRKGNPEGRSLLRNAYRPWFFKKRIEELEGIGLERDVQGIPKITLPASVFRANATPQEKATLDAAITMGKNLRMDEQASIIIPALYDDRGNKLYDVELMTTDGDKNFDTDKIIMRYNRTIALSMLADFVIIGHDNVGSFAMASAKTKVFSVAIGSYMDEIVEEINKRAIPTLLELNGIKTETPPELTHGDVETIDLDMLSKYINAMANAKIDMTSDDIRAWLSGQAGMPDELGIREDEVPTPFARGTEGTPDTGDDDS